MFLILEPLLYSGARLMPGVQSDLGRLSEGQINRLLKRGIIETAETQPKPKRKYTRRKPQQDLLDDDE